MRTYVDFDGKNAVPEWVEDCFDCVRSEDGKSRAGRVADGTRYRGCGYGKSSFLL